MKLENQVSTAIQSIRLKELGVIQESNYQWNLTTHAEPYLNVPPFGKVDNNGLSYAAFTVAELGVMLPTIGFEYVKSNNGYGTDVWWISSDYWRVKGIKHSSDNEAEARAAMLIYLLENNLTTAAEVNERLKNA